jgi:hypothetical protein
MKYTTLLLLFVCLSAKAQTRDSLFGKWVFESIAEEMNVSEEKRAKGQGLFEKITFVFFPDNSFESQILTKAEKGTWSFNDNKITNVLNDGRISSKLEILAFEPGKMKIKIGELMLNMKRTERFSNPQSLMYKWTFEGTRLDPEDEDLRPAPANNFIDIRPDNTYTTVIGPINETGLWYYDEKQNTIIATANGSSKEWKVAVLNDKTLEIYMNTKTGFVFNR